MSDLNNKVELSSRIKKIVLIAFFIISIGSLIFLMGGLFDSIAHLLQTQETFFSAEHTLVYAGISLMMVGAIICLFLFTLKKQVRTSPYSLAIKIVVISIFVLLIGATLDFWWHDVFGLDGVLTPNHLILVVGTSMVMLGSIIGLVKMAKESSTENFIIKPFLAGVFTSFWVTVLAFVYAFSSPFSKGELFDFTPDPHVAAIIAIITTPFLCSIIFWSISKTYNHFGAASIVTLLMLLSNIVTGIIPVGGLHVYLPWFVIPMIGAIIADHIIHNKKYKILQNHSEKIAGSIIGAVSLMLFFPWVGPVFLRLYVADGINPFDILPTSELLVAEIWLLISIPCAIIGMFGMMLAKKKLKLISIK